MENLISKFEGGGAFNIMDLKIGTSTITINAKSGGPEKIAKRIAKDAETTTALHGFKLVGYRLQDNAGDVVEVFAKKPKLTIEQSAEKIKMMFGAGSGQLNAAAIGTFASFLDDLVKFMGNDMPYEVRGISILLIVGHSGDVCVKLIDLASVEKQEDGFVDEGFITGIKNLQKIVADFM